MEETFSLNGYNDDSISTKDKKKNEDLPAIPKVVTILETQIDQFNRKLFCVQRERRYDLMIFHPFVHNAKVVLAKICQRGRLLGF